MSALSQIWRSWGRSRIRSLPYRETLCGGFTPWFPPSAKWVQKTTFTGWYLHVVGEFMMSCFYLCPAQFIIVPHLSAAFTKCFSQSNLRLTTSGTTGLQRATESECPSMFMKHLLFLLKGHFNQADVVFFFFSFFLRLCSEVPLLEDTLMRILVIGLSRDLPLGPADAMELADHLVKRAAGVQSDGVWRST